ncbi:glutamate receptor ionotropic, kainate 3-like [Hyposmocoma kahamanoa]|uniref:glutamate receptor ionotropic, kainate 3-like n=1 Tax=Hyposmocoma kahamanoa TaxID=1477025 RepID=UPI000E6D6F40|nr:glutamate receptor ionotropic, kainate 3-like [Hyposmocoma kahamanoa]
MGDTTRALLLLLLLMSTVLTQDFKVGVVDEWPATARALEHAAKAALAALNLTGIGEVEPAAVEPGEPLALPARICQQAKAGVTVVVGGAPAGDNAETARAARLAAEAAARAGVPLLLLQPAPLAASWEVLALYPHEDVVAQAGADLCQAKGWRRAVLLHEGSARSAALIAPDEEQLELQARRLPPKHDDALLRNTLLVLKKAGATNFIVWCGAECAVRVLDAAQRVGLLGARQSFVVLSLELHTQPLHTFSHGGANITGLMLFDPEADSVRDLTSAWREAEGGVLSEDALPPTAVLLAYDAVKIAARAHLDLRLARNETRAAPGDCDSGRGAFHADSLLNYLRAQEEWNGISGALSWEADGQRRVDRLQVVELQRGGLLAHAGVWTAVDGVAWERPAPADGPSPSPGLMVNRTFTVLIAMNDPYVMRRDSTDRLSGNDRYEECLLREEDLTLKKAIEICRAAVVSRIYSENVKNEMEPVFQDKHFAITDLTITAERESAVDFTTPFMNLGIGILFRKPKPPEPKVFAFMLPFSTGVWLLLGVAYLGTSLLLYAVGRLCPEEWQNPYPCIEEPVALENQFTLANALWFNLGAVLLQGSEIAPVAYGTRAVASVWWLFALVITSSYTANLATLLAQKTPVYIISNVYDLANNDKGILYGAKAGGSTFTFFEYSKEQSELYRKMYEEMSKQKMPESNEEGIKRVVEDDEKYAFLMESTTIEYTTERNCLVTKVLSQR